MKAGPLILVAALLSGLAIAPASAVADVPSPSASHSLESNGSATVGLVWYFGGAALQGPPNDELWSLRPSNVTWTKITPLGPKRPQARFAHLSAYDTDQQLYIVFGGFSTGGLLDDTWHYTPAANQWSSSLGCPDGPPPRARPAPRQWGAMAYDPASAEVAMFGGFDGSQALGDTWTLQIIDGKACWTECGSLDPSPHTRLQAAMVYVPTRGTLVLYGGNDAGNPPANLCDLWEWDGISWGEIAQTGGPCVRDHSLMFDELSGRLVVFGGWLSPQFDVLASPTFSYRFATGTWTEEASPVVSPPRAGSPMVLDREVRAFVLFGGTDGNNFLGDTVIIPIEFFDLRVSDPVNTILDWYAIPGALSYDVIRGTLSNLVDDGTFIRLGSVACIENNSLDTTTRAGTETANPDNASPLPGDGFFYLIRYYNGMENSSYGFTRQGARERVVDIGDCPP